MSTEQPTHFVRQYTDGITHLAEQQFSQFRGKTRDVDISGDRTYIDQIGSITAQKVSTRHADTPLTDTPQSRRQISSAPFKHADLIDKSDMVRTLNDPTNDYVIAFARGFARAMDQEVIDQAFASANTGVDGGTATAFPGGDFQIAAGGTGLTLAKILEANRVLRENENMRSEGFYLAVSQQQIEDMLNDSTFTSADYNSIRTLMTGEISQFMGFEWVDTELLGVTGSDRRCIAWAKNSLALGIGEEPSGRITERPDKNYSTQVFYSMDIGSTRLDETGVIEVLCAE